MASPENEENLEKPGGPRSAVRVMDILYKLSSASGRVSLAELSEGLELPKTSVFSLLRALDKGGYVIQARAAMNLDPRRSLGAAMVQRRAFPGFPPTLQSVAKQPAKRQAPGCWTRPGLAPNMPR